MNKSSGVSLVFASLLLFLMQGCSSCGGKKRYQNLPDVSTVKVTPVKLERFEADWLKTRPSMGKEDLAALAQKYPAFTDYFTQFVLELPKLPDTVSLERFLSNYLNADARKLNDTCQLVVGSYVPTLEGELTEMMKYYKHYFPKLQQPRFYTYLSYYSYGTPVIADGVGIGLDFFLTASHKAYFGNENLHHQYILRTLNKAHLLPKIGYAIADDIVSSVVANNGSQMLDALILEGKKYYLLDCLLPQVADSLKMGWTKKQLEFNERGEADLYKLLINENLIYTNKLASYRKFITAGPFSEDMPSENPGNSGSWLGWQMVAQYAFKTNANIEQVLKASPQQILQKYKPK